MAAPSSTTRVGKNEPFELQVARGQISWHTPVNIFGYQPAVGSGTGPIGAIIEGILIENDASTP